MDSPDDAEAEAHFFAGSPLCNVDTKPWCNEDLKRRFETPPATASKKFCVASTASTASSASAPMLCRPNWSPPPTLCLPSSFVGEQSSIFLSSTLSSSRPTPRLGRQDSYAVCDAGNLTHHGEKQTVQFKDGTVHDLYDVMRVRRLGRGASGSVYECVVSGGQRIAVKEIKGVLDDQAKRHQAFKELKILRAAHHPNILELRQAFFHDGVISLCLDYCDAGSLEHVVTRGGALPEQAAVGLIAQVTCGLEYIHDVTLHIHRDVKPGNVLMTTVGRAKVADFGLSLCLERLQTVTPTVSGTAAFLAPELLSSCTATSPTRGVGASYTTAVDVWALGLVTVEALSGQAPFAGLDRFRLQLLLEDASLELPSPSAEVSSPEARRFVASCLQRTPASRASCLELMANEWIAHLIESLPEAEEAVRWHLGAIAPA